jgi:hypothetical protein
VARVGSATTAKFLESSAELLIASTAVAALNPRTGTVIILTHAIAGTRVVMGLAGRDSTVKTQRRATAIPKSSTRTETSFAPTAEHARTRTIPTLGVTAPRANSESVDVIEVLTGLVHCIVNYQYLTFSCLFFPQKLTS